MQISGRDSSRYQTFTRRAALLAAAQGAAFVALAGRMYYLQVLKTDQYRMLAEENRVAMRLLAPLRGNVVDRFGRILASNRQNYRAMLISEQTPDVEATLDRLSRIIEINEFTRKRILRDIQRSPRFMPVTVAEGLTWREFAQVNINEPDLAGIQPDVGETRDYPYGEELAHILGYVAAVSEKDLQQAQGDQPLLKLPGFRIGKEGIEKTYDKELRGVAGSSHVEVNAYGRVIRELSKDPGKPGGEVVLTLDMDVQKFAWNRLKGESASSVVLDIHTGDVISFVSAPAYDPNQFNMGLSTQQWASLVENPYKPLINKALAGMYPPGSTFKMVVAMAAVEAGIDPNHRIVCPGHYSLGSHDFHCWKKGGHGAMNMHDAIKHSCDVYFYDTAKRIGIEAIADMSRRFGLGSVYDFEVPGEKPGLVPTPQWKRAARGEPWHPGETVIAGIGQGYLLATPLQLAVMTARIANGGFAVTPRLTRAIGGELLPIPQPERIGVSERAIEVAQGGMNAVSNEIGGTAYRSRISDPGMELAGKTGTAQVRRISRAERLSGVLKNEDIEWRQRDHALFVCFAPVHAPRYAMSVVIEHGGSGSGAAAPVARDIMHEVLIRNPVRPQATVPPTGAKTARAG
ncbi:Peptidoglycan glycosyltransferase [Parvibaculum lavamentivorans DS-1]|uniref:Peptidoglycan glycosyltransferase n=1 Tax=Parvibaculum lavamentivorans (strain DS-1 / DSM 13023 / NCIMB 13966) TaxID=402881 RepID=A7HW08_PARL1|nr:penicillin-binding protein 2 [Parvibaculum lavamentivorans]ABS64091.1 Peptidoglycan glycosyltransferase [Parvibaculum lavamentivorans DS-1]